MFDYLEFQEKNHLIPLKIEKKKEIYVDLKNIEDSWTGRMDAMFTNTFIQEAVCLIKNAIVVFELGYFDCAHYSLRQSLEVSTIMSYILELPLEERENKLEKWKKKKNFPMIGQMIDYLESNKEVYSNIYENMQEYFNMIKKTKKKLNKIVHKQGYDYFYISRNLPVNKASSYESYVINFLEILNVCIGTIAILRLSIDPMPVLLMDEEIFYRTGDMMTLPFSKSFIEKYIGLDNIEKYKLTDIYRNHYNDLIKKEKINEYATDVVKNHYIDKNKINEILMQKDLMDKSDLAAVLFSSKSNKISRIYLHGGLSIYLTNIESVRTKLVWGSAIFMDKKGINLYFDEAYVSHFMIADNFDIYVEHNEPFDVKEVKMLEEIKNEFFIEN